MSTLYALDGMDEWLILHDLRRYERIQMLEDAKKEKQALERERQELTLSGSLRCDPLECDRNLLVDCNDFYHPFLSTSSPVQPGCSIYRGSP